jgi:uncharacterized membrane protein
MAKTRASSSVVIHAPLQWVWELVADIEGSPAWQTGLIDVHVLERDDEGRATMCESESDAKVRTVRSIVRLSYEPPTRLTWTQEKGELKSIEGNWTLEDLGRGQTRATYAVVVDPGMMLGMIFRGPLGNLLRDILVSSRADELKRVAEGAELTGESVGVRD